jgi:hypothetical protein
MVIQDFPLTNTLQYATPCAEHSIYTDSVPSFFADFFDR